MNIEVMTLPIAFMFIGAMLIYAICTFDTDGEEEDE